MRKIAFTFIVCVAAISVVPISAYSQDSEPSNEQYFKTDKAKQARQDWILNCQGCHKMDGTGRPDKGLPNLTGEVSKFLAVEGGREYLSRVPGITNASVNNAELAELLNWLLLRFDPKNIPKDHKPYTAEEVTEWRKHPLSIGAEQTREKLLAKLSDKISEN